MAETKNEDRQLFARIWISSDGIPTLEITDDNKDVDVASIRNILVKILDALFASTYRSYMRAAKYIAENQSRSIVNVNRQRILNSESIRSDSN